jgi:subtilisin family serine protease
MASFVAGRRFIQQAAAFSAGLCLLLAAAETVLAATPTNDGAGYPHEIQQWIDEAGRDPAKAASAVTVILEADPSTTITSLVNAHGGKLRYRWNRLHEVSIPAGKLAALIRLLPAGTVVRPPYPHQALAVTGQGVALTGAADMHPLGTNGAGMKIGVIDLGFTSLASAQASGDLPANLIATDYTGTGLDGTMNHGTNVAQIVYEMAPGAQMYLARINTDVQLQQAMSDMAAAGVRVINHSVGWYGAAFYDGTGPICNITSQAEQDNILWVNSAGNDRYKHYMATLTDSNGDLRHEFAANQNYNTISLTAAVKVQLILNWDAYPTTSIDYNLYLYNGNPDAAGVIVAQSTTRQRGTGFSFPYEAITYTPSTSGTYYIVVEKYQSSTTNTRFALFSMGPNLGVGTYATSLVQPADCASVISVGATNLSDVSESYSAEGPTTDGRVKPEIAGPDRVQTSLTSTFAGTSAASPHVAGGVALLWAQNPTFTLAQIKWLLTSTAKDVNIAGYDYRTGYGRISLDADSDGFNHDSDNCPLVSNADQLDTDGDKLGNVCDSDNDNDNLSDMFELSIGTNPLLADTDGDGLSDYAEVCYDVDCSQYTPGQDLNPLSSDTDRDGIPDGSDPNPLVSVPTGDIAPLGAQDGVVDAADYIVVQRIVMGQLAVTNQQRALVDLYPANAPDGVIDLSDLIILLGRVQ